jgi:diacylglycerol kinase family enzyme
VAGGDGSVLRAAPAAIAAGVPVYHIPCGNENLFAREFRMDSSVQTLRRALDRRAVQKVDVGRVAGPEGDGGPFLIMCSLGPDASVIHRLDRVRTRALGHLAYMGPVLQELMAPSFPRLRVRVDGREVVDGRGILLVGNSRQYALRMDPAVRASMSDGLLDVVFLPCEGRAGALAWGLRCRLGRQSAHSKLVYVQGREIEIEPAEGEAVYQVDGEAGCSHPAGTSIAGALRLTLSPACLPVLVP